MSSPPSGPNYSWQPQPGDYKSAPTYGQPPRKNRGGLIIALIVVLVLVALGAIGLLAYRLVSDHRTTDRNPGSAAAPSPTTSNPKPTTRPTPARPTAVRPTTARPRATGAVGATDLARRFVTQLNANNSTAAAALACESSRQVIPQLMQTFLTPPTKLTTGKLVGQQTTFVIPLTGTTKSTTVTGVIVVHELPPEPLCIRAFQITTITR